MSKNDSSEPPSSEVLSLITGGVPYFNALRLYFTNPEELGKRIGAREWTGISKPLSVGSTSIAVLAVVFWIVGAGVEIGKFPAMLLEYARDWPFFFGTLGFLLATQVVATKTFSLKTFISCIFAFVYALGFFVLPLGAIILLVHFMDSIINLGKDFPMFGVLLIAPLFGYTILLGMTRLLGGVLRCGPELVFGVLIAWAFITTQLPGYLRSQ